MKQKLFASALFIISVFTLTSFSIRENPQDPPRGKKAQKHIVIEKIDDNGNKISLDTIIGGNDIFVWYGDTIGGKSAFSWNSKDGFIADSVLKSMNFNFEYEIDDKGDNKVIVIKSGNGDKKMIHEFINDTDSNKMFMVHVNSDDLEHDEDIMIWNDDAGNKTFFAPHVTELPHLPDVPRIMIREKINHDNVIDLSDPGIVSYKKKMNKDGTEKITIVRKQIDENSIKHTEEIIMAPEHGSSDVFFDKTPEVKRIKIIKENGKEVEVEEENMENN